MRVNRLSDIEIQRYLDDSLSRNERAQIEPCLSQGKDNAGLLDDYSILYEKLADCEVAPLSKSFADGIMDRIAKVEPARPRPSYVVHPVILLALLAGVSILVYIVNPLNVLSILSSFSLPDGWELPDLSTLVAMIEVLKVKTVELGRVVPYLGVSAAALICFTLLEHMLLEPQLKRI